MPETSGPTLSVAGLFAERDARRRRDQHADEQLQRRREEEVAEFKKRLDNFQLTDEIIHSGLDRIKRAFERGETELMFASFPSSFCTDDSRAVINGGAPPISRPSRAGAGAQSDEPERLATAPAGALYVYEDWKNHLRLGGFTFTAHMINYPGGKPGDLGLFFSWPKDSAET